MSVGETVQPPAIQVLYRYTPAANNKARPSYFSKTLALQSFINALQATDKVIKVKFLVDGHVEHDVRTLMESVGEIVVGSWNSNRSSYLAQLHHAKDTQARLVWFAEDDYLYSRESLSALAQAVDSHPEVDWFALSGPTPLQRLELRRAQSAVPLPNTRRWSASQNVDHAWRRIDSTTSTFGGRPRAIRRATWLLRLCPWSGAAWDRTTCLALQGATPYPWKHVLHDLLPPSTPPGGWARVSSGESCRD